MTGAELAEVAAAVTGKDSSVTVVGVRKDADGSFDVFGTKSGDRVMFEVSADLQTITESAGRAGGPGGMGAGDSERTPVTGAELAEVAAAVTGKDSSVTVVGVRKDADGSFDVFGTKSGDRVMFEVSADLQTITESSGPGGHR